MAAIAVVASAVFAPSSASAATWTFDYTGGVQTWTVPAGVTSANFDLYGASGGTSNNGTPAAKGGRARADLSLTPGSTVRIYVGGAGGYPGAGWNGGGNGVRFGGGGATDVRIGGTGLGDRKLVAGGGGGEGQYIDAGGAGGGLTGTGASGGFGGGGGTQTSGGSGTYPDWAGSFGQGGTNGGVNMTGGGGGGWFGGGGGPGGGGGGSGYGPGGTTFETGVRTGNGTATITVPERTLTVATRGTFPGPADGRGFITSSPAGISCGWPDGIDCSHDYLQGTSVTLTATPFTGWSFVRWEGDCTGTDITCSFGMDSAKNVEAVFEITRMILTVSKPGNGSGTVTSSPAGVNCGATCSGRFLPNATVTLTATEDTGSDFTGWGGACSGTQSTCTLTMSESRNVSANFTLETRTLSASKTGSGSGSITSSPTGLSCGATCQADFDYGTEVTLTANPATGSTFSSWGAGACQAAGSNPTCTVTMDQARSVQAGFALGQRALTVTRSASGTGTVTSSPSGINCASTCSANFDYGTEVTLTATPGANSDFGGWSGPCFGSGSTCTVTLNQARTVDAAFPLQKRTLSVSRDGNGTGSVSSVPAGIDCGTTCAADYDHGASVTLTATPGVGSDFAGWGGACSGTQATCTVSMTQARSAMATFTLQKRALSVSRDGNGAGAVSSSPAGIDCGSTCSADFDHGIEVTLTAAAGANSDFTGWSGACAGTDAECTVTMDQARSVSATFSLQKRELSVERGGTGAGSVSSAPAGIDCGTTCAADYDHGTSVTLTPAAGANSDFTGWGGACSGSGTECTVTMDQARAVTAAFTLQKRTLNVSTDGTGSGAVTSFPAGIDCGSACSAGFDHGTEVTLVAEPASGSAFIGWGGDCVGNKQTCTVTMDQARAVTASFGDTTAPDTTITKQPKRKTKKRGVKIAFASDKPGATFECSLNGEAFRTCSSPAKIRVPRGRNVFAVRAVSAAGVVDPTPAVIRFKVLKKKR